MDIATFTVRYTGAGWRTELTMPDNVHQLGLSAIHRVLWAVPEKHSASSGAELDWLGENLHQLNAELLRQLRLVVEEWSGERLLPVPELPDAGLPA